MAYARARLGLANDSHQMKDNSGRSFLGGVFGHMEASRRVRSRLLLEHSGQAKLRAEEA